MLAYLCPVGQSQSELQVNPAYFKNEYTLFIARAHHSALLATSASRVRAAMDLRLSNRFCNASN